jgi:hypothetical protein
MLIHVQSHWPAGSPSLADAIALCITCLISWQARGQHASSSGSANPLMTMTLLRTMSHAADVLAGGPVFQASA